jgi:predicted nucleic acid binding AN1-type Zn finger protein
MNQYCNQCRQCEFLPITCDYCHRYFCKDHSNYLQHDCDGHNHKNKLSTDCLLCKTSVAYYENENISEIMKHHYEHECAKKRNNTKRLKCIKCEKNVTYVHNLCGSCNEYTCIEHRLPGEHNCAKIISNHI